MSIPSPISSSILVRAMDEALALPPGQKLLWRQTGGGPGFSLTRARNLRAELGKKRKALLRLGDAGFPYQALTFNAVVDLEKIAEVEIHWVGEPRPLPDLAADIPERSELASAASACYIRIKLYPRGEGYLPPVLKTGSATAPAPSFKAAWESISRFIPGAVEIANTYSAGVGDWEIRGEAGAPPSPDSFESFAGIGPGTLDGEDII